MALQIYSGTNTGTGTRVALGENDDVFIGVNAVIGSTDTATTITGTGSNHEVEILGSVTASNRTINLGDSMSTDSGQYVHIAKSGYLHNLNNFYALLRFEAFDSTVINDGTMSFGSGVLFVGTSTTTTSTLINNGTMLGNQKGSYAVSSQGTEDVYFENNGTISAKNIFLQQSTAEVTIINNGKMKGAIQFGSGADKFDTRDASYSGQVSAGGGADVLYGSAKADTFNGDADNDKLYSYDGADILSGGAGDDYISASNGQDRLTGDLGKDELRGGADADTFIFKTSADSTTSTAGRDLILDFSQSQKDKIDLSAIDAKISTGTNNSFSFIGKNSYTETEGQLRYRTENGVTKIYGDTNGDGTSEFAIWLDGIYTLKATDFIL